AAIDGKVVSFDAIADAQPLIAAVANILPLRSDRDRHTQVSDNLHLTNTREFVMACTESAIRFCTPTLRISLATWALTVRSLMPSGAPISLFDWPATSISKTSFSRSVKVTRPAGKMGPGAAETRSMNIDRTRRGAQTDALCTTRIACTNSFADAA